MLLEIVEYNNINIDYNYTYTFYRVYQTLRTKDTTNVNYTKLLYFITRLKIDKIL